MDRLKFQQACDKIYGGGREINGIGTLSEKTVHAILKNYFEPHTDNHEIRIGSFVADIAGENGIIEIQTRSFNALIKKLDCFLDYTNVTVVYPIAGIKYLRWLDTETGEMSPRRKSPKIGSIYDAIPELYKIKYTLDNPNMSICLVLLETEEIRYLDGWSYDKKRGSSRCDGRPIDIIDEIYFKSTEDFRIYLPDTLSEKFTSAELAKKAKITRKKAQTLLNILSYLEIVKKVGKNGNEIIYTEIQPTVT